VGKSNKNRVKKPSALLYFGVAPWIKAYYRWVYGHRVDKSGLAGLKPPYLVLAGHASWLDYLIVSASMFPVRMNFVGAYNFFRDRVLKTVFTWMGVIPRRQFTIDTRSVLQMKYCVDQGRAVALFPHGCLSNEGRPGGYAGMGLGKLIKFLKVPVVAVHTDGAYLTRPRWSKTARRGRMETKVSLVLTAREVSALSAREVYERALEAVRFDDYRWQRERRVPFAGKNTAEGAEFVLYKCPRCAREFTLRSQKDRLFCEACGNAVRMNRYLLFEPESPDTVAFDGIDRWYDFQREALEEEIQAPDFCLEAQAEYKTAQPGLFGYQHRGFGRLKLTKDAITYTGTNGGEEQDIALSMRLIPMIPYAANEYIEVSLGEDLYRFILDDRRQMIKWVMAVRQIRDKYYEGEHEP